MPKIPSVGNVIRDEREKRAWTQEQLAEIAGIGPRTLQRVEAEHRASLETLRAVAEVFDLEYEELLERAASTQEAGSIPLEFLPRVTSGRGLGAIMGGAEMFYQDHDELDDAETASLIAGFVQELQDLGDLWPEFEAGYRIEMAHHLGVKLSEIETSGFKVFGKRATRLVPLRAFGEEEVSAMSIAFIVVLHYDNPRIVATSTGELLPVLVPYRAP